MGYIKRNFNSGSSGDLLDTIISTFSSERPNCVTILGEWETDIWFGSLELNSDCFEMTQNARLEPFVGALLCEPPEPPNYAQSDPDCNKNENETFYYFYTGSMVGREGVRPVCTLSTEGGLIYDDPLTPETWECLERWCNDIVDYDKPYCEYRGTIKIVEIYDFKYCAPDEQTTLAMLDHFNAKPKNTEPKFVTGGPGNGNSQGMYDFMKPLIEKALLCICEAIRERDVRKLQDALTFLNHDQTFGGCQRVAYRECEAELGFGPMDGWSNQQFIEFFACVTQKVEACMREYADELLCFD